MALSREPPRRGSPLCSQRWVGHVGQHEACRDLVLIEKGQILLIDAAADQVGGAGRTRLSPAGHRQIDVLISRSIKDRLVVAALNAAAPAGSHGFGGIEAHSRIRGPASSKVTPSLGA